MDIFTAMQVSASALAAQQTRLNVISGNLANVGTTRTPEGGPYRKRDVVFQSSRNVFEDSLRQAMDKDVQGVEVARIQPNSRAFHTVYQPGHPDADENGMLTLPNINVMEEMVDMMTATRNYEANVSAIKSAQRMATKALDIGR
ncbi:MAG: flagellar basal body rod protein FlgC [Syntrophotalea acetylenica]|jgi:flagellar basal-body rod protein FlgC|uniref:Flagellar basal-body rod protein FlgC n=1 Tax=Syntrophotalea acetylenica TaxID=29542 RepID=A0A1L3GCZ5_SYNAC|nr:flagellar basal body rod protein FlgC [Syntrophotalea acetylenica]APG23705.1 flagellar basal body rod protein FlgC [Syntrophotalea acetylenica]APG44282.1 flagellar basal body rod protein FlgC [Syntrophotalea acetylenica]MDD4457160.1 flagellar basal body rod protein FlgC [Syntrophotalea acetylenica]MDY0262847.1 flagellar basal body rod protein FlgC [Syntrophotalea acetylenica]